MNDCLDLRRTIVIGMSGSGKTTLGQTLAQLLKVPHIELDALHWGPNWTPRDKTIFRTAVEQAILGNKWVIDGNYNSIRDLVWPKATTIIWLDYPFLTVFWRVFSRTIRRMISREILFSGNQESFRLTFLDRDSLLWWVITTYSRRRFEFKLLRDENLYPNLTWLTFTKPAELDLFLKQIDEKYDLESECL